MDDEFFNNQHPPSSEADRTGKALWHLRPTQAATTNPDGRNWFELSLVVDGHSETLRAKLVVDV